MAAALNIPASCIPGKISASTQNPCGSEPARESGVPVNVDVTDPPPSRAGSFPPCFMADCRPSVPWKST